MQSTETSQVHLSPSVTKPLSPERVDALKEVANIGAGHAATALSLMTGARIMIDVPTINVAPLSELIPGIAEQGSQVVSVPLTWTLAPDFTVARQASPVGAWGPSGS